jgi:uncharacterized membrane protein
MVQTKFNKFVTFFVTVLFTLTFVNAASSFDISPTSVTESLTIGGNAHTVEYTITNSGATDLTANIAKINPIVSGDSVSTSLNASTITVLAAQTGTFSVTYTASSIGAGTYLGNVTVTDSTNASEFEVSSTTLNVIQLPGAALKISLDSNTVVMKGDIDEKETKSFRIENIGTVDLNNIDFNFFDLDGQDFGDEIEDNDLEMDDDKFDLDVGKSKRVELEVDIPKGIEVDTYTGVFTIKTTEGYELDVNIELEVEGGDIEIEFDDLYEKNGVELVGEPDESVDDYEIRIENLGDVSVRNLQLVLEDNFEEINSNEELSKTILDLSDWDNFDLESSDYEDIDLKIDVPENAKTGTYIAQLEIQSSDGKDTYDTLRIELKVIGDVYISKVEYDKKANQDENLDVKVEVTNQGSKTQKNIKVTGTIIGIDLGSSDLIESSSTFILTADQIRTETLRFEIPESARDGTHTLEIAVSYGDGTLTELEEIEITRPDNLLTLESSGIGQNIIKCDDSLYVFAKVKNIGKYDQTATFTTEILGTGIKKEIKDINIDVDETFQQNFNLQLTNLEEGSYEVQTKVLYDGFFLKDSNTIVVRDCNGASTGIDVKPIEDDNIGNETIDVDSKTFDLFGQELEQTQVYLIAGISIIMVLIIISLFFI